MPSFEKRNDKGFCGYTFQGISRYKRKPSVGWNKGHSSVPRPSLNLSINNKSMFKCWDTFLVRPWYSPGKQVWTFSEKVCKYFRARSLYFTVDDSSDLLEIGPTRKKKWQLSFHFILLLLETSLPPRCYQMSWNVFQFNRKSPGSDDWFSLGLSPPLTL